MALTFAEKYNELLESHSKLKQKYDALLAEKSNEMELQGGSGLYIKKDDLDRYLLISKTHPILTRHLFRHFFTIEELTTHSLFGKMSNANRKEQEGGEPLPELNPRKRNAIFGKNVFCYSNVT